MATFALIVAFAASNVTTCKNECQLNGECIQGVCRCDKGWKGDECGLLDLKPTPTVAYGHGPLMPYTSSWGGGPPVFDSASGQYHLAVTCNLIKQSRALAFTRNSGVQRLSDPFFQFYNPLCLGESAPTQCRREL